MNESEIKQIIVTQRNYFQTGKTLPVTHRIKALGRLKESILLHETEINSAIKKDLGKSAFETYMCETGLVLSEISYMLKHIHSYTKEKTVYTPLAQFHSRSYKKPSPYGVVLIMSPWNYPFLLTIDPLVDAIAAGNTAVVKPSAYSPHTSEIMKKILEECFSPEFVSVVTGGRTENTCLLNEHFDYIFFTGSPSVGKDVMRKASEHLTPVTLELGGKSPCIVDASDNIKLTAKRIVFGKYLNCGQTCVAPDYVYCDRKVKKQLLQEIKKQINKQYGKQPLTKEDYGKIINEKHFDRICELIDHEKGAHGGASLRASLQIEPTVMDNVTFADPVMQEEIFGPLLPVIGYRDLAQAIGAIKAREKPLALYLFTQNKKTARRILHSLSFGGGCVNDVVLHITNHHLPFGGVGNSGMGAYHGKFGFETFSHQKGIVKNTTLLDVPVRYAPFNETKLKLLRKIL